MDGRVHVQDILLAFQRIYSKCTVFCAHVRQSCRACILPGKLFFPVLHPLLGSLSVPLPGAAATFGNKLARIVPALLTRGPNLEPFFAKLASLMLWPPGSSRPLKYLNSFAIPLECSCVTKESMFGALGWDVDWTAPASANYGINVARLAIEDSPERLYRGHIWIIEKKMENYLGFRV